MMNSITPSTIKLLTFAMVKKIGSRTLKEIASLNNFKSLSLNQIITQIPKLSSIFINDKVWNDALLEIDYQLNFAAKDNVSILSILDENFPILLKNTNDGPVLIFVKGTLHTNPLNSVTIIGTREPSQHGQIITQRITEFFVENNWSIVSGLALGCDSIAHNTALKNNGHTVAVLAHGLQIIAPKSNNILADSIINNGGALISEFPYGQAPLKHCFVQRDITQACLSRGVCMIQSDINGGSLHASKAALKNDRWLAVPYPTSKDIENNYPKIQANLVLADENKREKIIGSNSKNLIILKSKQDYPLLIHAEHINANTMIPTSLSTLQNSLF
jgi:DNA protecting protein DprA